MRRLAMALALLVGAAGAISIGVVVTTFVSLNRDWVTLRLPALGALVATLQHGRPLPARELEAQVWVLLLGSLLAGIALTLFVVLIFRVASFGERRRQRRLLAELGSTSFGSAQ